MAYIAPIIGVAGLTIPSYQDVLDYLIEVKSNIYGSDIYLGEDSTDYQELSVFALMIYDVLQTLQLVYNNRAPSTAIGSGLDSIVKVNGIKRNEATNSTVDVTVAGTAGTVITNGVVSDAAGNKWNLPASVTIPIGGSIVVTATAQEVGSLTATPGTVTIIETPTSGWLSVTNAGAATEGVAVETDALLRSRQSIAIAAPSLSVIEGIVAALLALDGVESVSYKENKTGSTDGDGIPGHSVAFIIGGGDATEIANTINSKMTPGTGYYGDITVQAVDGRGIITEVDFSRPTEIEIDVEVTITSLTGYTAGVGDMITAAVEEYLNALSIGQDVLWSRVLGSSLLTGVDGSDTFNVTAVTMCRADDSPYNLAEDDIVVAYSEQAVAGTITLVVS